MSAPAYVRTHAMTAVCSVPGPHAPEGSHLPAVPAPLRTSGGSGGLGDSRFMASDKFSQRGKMRDEVRCLGTAGISAFRKVQGYSTRLHEERTRARTASGIVATYTVIY